MKHFLPILIILGLNFACATPNNSKQKDKIPEPSISQKFHQKDLQIIHKSQIPPGTCHLIITNCNVIADDHKYVMKGIIESVIAYGAAFDYTFPEDNKIKISINPSQFSNLKGKNRVRCLIASTTKKNQASKLNLLKSYSTK